MRLFKIDKLKRAVSCALAALCLTGCGAGDDVTDTAPFDSEETFALEEPLEAYEPEEANAGYTAADTLFSINYNPDASLNPLYGTNRYNNDLFGLMYEGLFRLTDGFEAEPVLCSEYSTVDGITFTFKLLSGVKFHDGSPLTASDVEYTINKAAGSSKYRSRLSSIIAVNASDNLTLVVTLNEANYGFPALLDIPVVKSGTGDDSSPVGTGPYVMRTSSNGAYLSPYTGYRSAGSLPLACIYLQNKETQDLAEAFSGRVLDIIGFDPTGIQSLNIHMEYETRYYDTTNFIYLGFNTAKGPAADNTVRRAISCLVDIDTIASDVLSGAAIAAPLVLSPALSCYNGDWEPDSGYSRQKFIELITSSGVTDGNNDGFWDFPGLENSSLTLIVNEENSYKVTIANMIVTELRLNGLQAEVIPLPYDRYIENLAAGTYDLYIGEAKLTADFDLSALLTPGGSLNYGKISDENYGYLISRFLSTPAGEEHDEAARALCLYVKEEAPIVPIAYKKYAVVTHVGVASGLSPSQSGIFTDITDWSITLK